MQYGIKVHFCVLFLHVYLCLSFFLQLTHIQTIDITATVCQSKCKCSAQWCIYVDSPAASSVQYGVLTWLLRYEKICFNPQAIFLFHMRRFSVSTKHFFNFFEAFETQICGMNGNCFWFSWYRLKPGYLAGLAGTWNRLFCPQLFSNTDGQRWVVPVPHTRPI